MPKHHSPVVDWPPELSHLLEGVQFVSGNEGHWCCHIDVDVDARSLRAIHEFEAHLRRRRVQLRLAGRAGCVSGEMNPSIGLGAPSDRAAWVAKVRISFHDLQDGDCVEEWEGE